MAEAVTMTAWQIARNRTSWPCGCVTWYEWEPAGSGEWVRKRHRCYRHESGTCHG